MGKGNHDEYGSTAASRQWFLCVSIIAQIPGIIALILIAVLLSQYEGGFGWGTSKQQIFNYHPLFMTLGMVYLYGNAILVYRIFHDVKKSHVKLLHACLLIFAIIFASIALAAVIDSQHLPVTAAHDFKSLHSWTGITTFSLFCLQWVCGFVSFLFPKLKENIRSAYLPTHKLWGKIIFSLAIGTVLMGITEYGISGGFYSSDNQITQRNILNVFGIFIMIFGTIVIYLVSNPGFQRPLENPLDHEPLVDR